ncbi:tetratricopeptide repeat protein [Paracidobacterium acidisoli]|uniref:Cytochrome c-552/4 domain-containing protein n=1 Tax=Paracidobacterium acidisoli TaxID=2303751 RepID=A0A372IKM3_9BACT|nr:tetratricopeptide repeat protein [Paracidobacterium acidisoli]MBT9332881.1 tetratricopeptide repeat protein [Paracidobacterium acidisoli]
MRLSKTRLRIVLFSLLAIAGAGLCLRSVYAGSGPDLDRKDYTAHVLQNYDLPFGKEQMFLPSNAQTSTGEFIPASAFPTAQYCGHCHKETYHEWRESLHANSFREPFYKKNVELLNTTQGIAFSRHCEGCHDPVALLSGALTSKPFIKDRHFDNDGVTCSVCHSIQKLEPSYGVASYVMGVPAVIVDANGKPIPGEVPYSEILAHTDRHVAAVMKDFYRTPEYCGACHKANLPGTLNNYKWLRAIGLYDEWQASSFSHRSPLPFYSKPFTKCQDCHMPEEKATLSDYAVKDGKIASHRWVAGNTAVPYYFKYKDQVQRTEEFLQKDRLNVDLFAIRRTAGGPWIAPLGATAFDLKPNDNVETAVVIQNKGIGHTLIPEQRDIFEAWVEFTVKDARGRVIAESGAVQPDGTLDPEAHSFVTRMLDDKGRLLIKHEVWLRHTNASDTTIASGRSSVVRYQFHIPAGATGPLTVTAKVNYRHFNEPFTDFILGKKHPAYPVTEMASRTRTFVIGHNPAEAHAEQDNPDWMRWNNFGIGLLDAQQYAEAVDAFTHVAEMRPDYADARTNLGLAYYQWEKYEPADREIAKALEMSPGNPRALYYQALVYRNEGKLSAAITDLEKVADEFPQSPDAHRELGFSYYQLHKYELAEKQYQILQGIDPDALPAHYILAIVYRRLGKKDLAAQEAARFADEKDDPMASTNTLEYLEKNPEFSEESVPWHLHSTQTAEPGPAVARGK